MSTQIKIKSINVSVESYIPRLSRSGTTYMNDFTQWRRPEEMIHLKSLSSISEKFNVIWQNRNGRQTFLSFLLTQENSFICGNGSIVAMVWMTSIGRWSKLSGISAPLISIGKIDGPLDKLRVEINAGIVCNVGIDRCETSFICFSHSLFLLPYSQGRCLERVHNSLRLVLSILILYIIYLKAITKFR